MPMVDYALRYLNLGFSVIPIKTDGTKKPHVEWTEWQTKLAPENQIKEWWQKWPKANIGIVTGKISMITVFDFDWYKLTPEEIAKYKKDFPEVFTPTAFSPRKGEHRYFQYDSALPTRNGILKALDIKNDGGYVIAPPSFNDAGKYSWSERAKISDTTLHAVPLSYKEVLSIVLRGVIGGGIDSNKNNNVFYARNTDSAQQSVTDVTIHNINNSSNRVNFNEGTRDESLFHLANCLKKGGMPVPEIEEILRLCAIKICNPPFPLNEIPDKVKSATQRSERSERSLTNEIRELIAQQSGNINITLCQQLITNVTQQDKAKIRTILSRLAKEGLLERTGRILGEYRIVEKDFNVVNAADIEIEKGIDISLPFMLEQYVDILPKDLIVIAGTPNAGKTALLLDMVARNQSKFECWYFSTEMGQQACARRLAMRDPHIDWNFKFVQDFGAYEDVIKPDCMNFIDYVEQNEGEAFKIPGILAKIQRKLKNGVAVVALQKNKGKGWAVGGEQTRAKPTLFLSVESDYPGQKLRIEKAKAFKDYNPNGFSMKFKIVKGINLINMTDWSPEIA